MKNTNVTFLLELSHCLVIRPKCVFQINFRNVWQFDTARSQPITHHKPKHELSIRTLLCFIYSLSWKIFDLTAEILFGFFIFFWKATMSMHKQSPLPDDELHIYFETVSVLYRELHIFVNVSLLVNTLCKLHAAVKWWTEVKPCIVVLRIG